MVNEPRLKILGRSRQLRGKIFERFIEILLNDLGYSDFRSDINFIGMEIDIKAKRKVTNQSILCECKAHSKPIGSKDITDFIGKVTIKGSKNPSIREYLSRYQVIAETL